MIKLAVVIPIGPNCNPKFVCDTVESVKVYTTPDRHILLADDSQKGVGAEVAITHPDVEVMTIERNLGKLGGLYLNLCLAFSHLLDTREFRALLRLDTDALVTGPNPEADAINCFNNDPLVGSAGNYTHEYGGRARDRDRGWVAIQVFKQTSTWRFFRRPRCNLALRGMIRKAYTNGYYPGEEVFGGACFYSWAGLRALREAGYLPNKLIANVLLEEDEIFGLALRACGYHFVDLWLYNQSFACSHGCLPASPANLVAAGVKVVHSVRDYNLASEEEVRAFFRKHRQGFDPRTRI